MFESYDKTKVQRVEAEEPEKSERSLDSVLEMSDEEFDSVVLGMKNLDLRSMTECIIYIKNLIAINTLGTQKGFELDPHAKAYLNDYFSRMWRSRKKLEEGGG